MKENKSINEVIKLYKTGNLKKAKEEIDRLLEKDENSEFLNIKGIILRANGELRESLISYNRAISINSSEATYFNNRGNLYRELENYKKALNDFNKALDLDPKFFDALINLILLEHDKELYKESEHLCKEAIKINNDRSEGYKLLGISYLNQKKISSAIEYLEKAQKIKFETVVQHQLDILNGKQKKHTPLEFIQNTFNSYAKNFDEHLIQKLKYNGPKLIQFSIESSIQKKLFNNVIDLGCGTGLCGDFLSKVSSNLHGIDISFNMLKKAKDKNKYNELIKGDFLEYLKKTENRYDLFIACDVFIYTGDIDETFKLIKKTSSKESYFVFTTELLKKGNYNLDSSGRFKHSENYISSICEENSMEIINKNNINLRIENDKNINGQIYVTKL
tara:strand:+ start:135 stop:1307 length:1173 start_codon:yes stop_codon:yes gene_type:complete